MRGKAEMQQQVNLDGLPEPIAKALIELVDAIRQYAGASSTNEKRPVDLPVWEGMCVKPWKRADLYEEYLDHKFPPHDQPRGENAGDETTSEP